MSFRNLILGLLAQKPMSGYDIKKYLETLNWLIGSPSFGSLYPTLHALLEDGLVSVNESSEEGGPNRKVYSVTDEGKKTLQKWINQPVDPGAPLKVFVMRLLLADSFSPAGLFTHLQQRRSQVAAHRADLEEATRTQGEITDLGHHLALNYGLAVARAELSWLDRTLKRMSEHPLSVDFLEGEQSGLSL